MGCFWLFYTSVFPSKREEATPRGLADRARLGVRSDPHFLYIFLRFVRAQLLTAPLVEECDTKPAASGAEAGSQNGFLVFSC
jgi:hypothetical protein